MKRWVYAHTANHYICFIILRKTAYNLKSKPALFNSSNILMQEMTFLRKLFKDS